MDNIRKKTHLSSGLVNRLMGAFFVDFFVVKLIPSKIIFAQTCTFLVEAQSPLPYRRGWMGFP